MSSYHNLDDTIKYLLDPYAHEAYLEAERHCELQDACRDEVELSEAYTQWSEEPERQLLESADGAGLRFKARDPPCKPGDKTRRLAAISPASSRPHRQGQAIRCYFCSRPVPRAQLNNHHLIPKSQGGIVTAPAHRSCHTEHHSTNGHFRAWGQIGGHCSAITRRWAFNLKHVRDDPAYELERQFYRLYYARA